MLTATLGGYYIFGFTGFIYGAALSGVGPLWYYLWLQKKRACLCSNTSVIKLQSSSESPLWPI